MIASQKLSMKKVKFSLVIILAVAAFTSCRDKREPGRVYMPDMAYSRAYEAYAQNNLKQDGINYVNYPVDGTVRRGDLFAYTLTNDSNGYKMAAEVKNPLPPLDSTQMLEAQRLFNINSKFYTFLRCRLSVIISVIRRTLWCMRLISTFQIVPEQHLSFP